MKKKTLDVVLKFFESTSGLDIAALKEEVPKTACRLLKAKSAHWLDLEDISGHGHIYSSGKLNSLMEKRIRHQIACGLRDDWVTWYDKKYSYIEVQLPGRLGYLVVERALSKDWMEAFRRILHTCWNSAIKLQDAKDRAFVDDVTQLYNQRYLHLVLEKEIRRAEREKLPFSVLFIDVDRFKSVNDSAGHLVGSKLLGSVADILRQNSRLVDYAFRYGGDEFVLVLVGTDAPEAHSVGERIRKQVEDTSFVIDEKPVNLTISIGIASFPVHAKRKEDILRMADEAMYQSKNRNRNSVSLAS